VHQYHQHPFHRTPCDLPLLWQQGTTRLFDYGAKNLTGGIPLLVIPSLVNRAYILDLLPEKSFLQFLSVRGFRPLLIDWDTPGDMERNFGLSGYITQHLLPIYDFVRGQYDTPPAVMGYCMGGNLALALAQLAVSKPPAMVLLATAWDFHAPGMPRFTPTMAEQLMQIVMQKGELPVDWLQSFFAALDPFGAVQKFMKFAEMDMHSNRAHLFVALEDWLSDGVPLTPRVALETMQDWYAFNTPMKNAWRIADHIINPATLNIPTLAVLPQQDRIVSPASAAALAGLIPGALSLTPSLGHIGMIAGRDAQTKVWQPIADWLHGKEPKSDRL